MTDEHTAEPWPFYVDVAVEMSPNPDVSSDMAPLSFDDYERARICVNACAGIDSKQLEATNGLNELYAELRSERDTAEQQRDKLLAAISNYLAKSDAEIKARTSLGNENHSYAVNYIPKVEALLVADRHLSEVIASTQSGEK